MKLSSPRPAGSIVDWRLVPALAGGLSVVYLLTFVLGARDSAFFSRADIAAGALGGGGLITFLFPVALLLPAALSWSAVTGHRALLAIHVRTELRKFLARQLAHAFLSTAATIWVAHMIVFGASFYVLSSTGLVRYVPEGRVTWQGEVSRLANEDQFGALALIHPLAWAAGESGWHALWAGLLALLACAALLILSNRFLALSLPALIFYVGSLVLGAVPPMHVVLAMVVFPTLWGPQGWGVFLVPLAALVVVTAGVVVYALARLPSTPVMR